LDGASNDTWRIGDRVLRVCWRGDLDRMGREAELLAALPPEIPAARPLDCGRDEQFSWLLLPRLPGTTLSDAWPVAPERELRAAVAQLAHLLACLHAWVPPVKSASEPDR
jgi:aminoglycoside phosphotransferase